MMGSFNVLVNGALRTTTPDLFADGSTASPGIAFTSTPTLGFYKYNATSIGAAIGGNPAVILSGTGVYINSNGAINMSNSQDAASGIDTRIVRASATKAQLVDAGSTLGTFLCGTLGDSSNVLTVASTRVSLSVAGALDFAGAASTFASVATITNGPRAANPVNWVKVKYNGGASSGRLAIW